MLPKWHILIGVVLVLILFIFNISFLNSLIFFLASILIDFDHYLYYIYRKKDFNLKKAYKWFVLLENKFYSFPKEKKRRYEYGFCIFHGIEPLLILFLISLIPELSFFFFIFLGFFSHIIQDAFCILYKESNPFVVLSIIYKLNNKKGKINLENYISIKNV